MFDFSASVNDVAPVSPMLFPVCVMRKEKVICWCTYFVFLLFFCFHYPDRVSWVLCLISVLCSTTMLLWIQCRCLLVWMKNEKSELFMGVFCVSSFFCIHDSDWDSWVLCLISIPHSMVLLLFLQSRCLLQWRERKRVICWWMSFVCRLSFVFTT